jgi:hypothetical protein
MPKDEVLHGHPLYGKVRNTGEKSVQAFRHCGTEVGRSTGRANGMAARYVPDRLARDFWVRPDEKMVREWCRAYAAEIDFAVDYQPWVIANFSGILCVDEVYQGDLALLLADDPAAPDGDRRVGYALLPKTREVDQGMVRAFVDRLRTAGVDPDEVITDDSRLYPAVPTEIWPTARHQLCLFHATRRVVRAVSD